MLGFTDFASLHVSKDALRCKSVATLRVTLRRLLSRDRCKGIEHGIGLRLHAVEIRHILGKEVELVFSCDDCQVDP